MADYPSRLLPVFCANVRRVMNEKDVTQVDLAERSGIPQPAISRLLSLQRNSATIATLERIADALDTPIAELLFSEISEKASD